MMDCINHFNEILNELPASEAAFRIAKEGVLKQMASSRARKTGVINRYIMMKRMGFDRDVYADVYRDMQPLTLDDIVRFEKANMAHKPFRYIILGDEKELDMEALGKIGPIRRLTTEEIFGY